MAQQNINVGSGEYSGDGESLRSAFTKTNANFGEVYANIADILSTSTTSQLGNGNNHVVLEANGKLTAPENLQVNGGKIILNTAGNAYIESVNYGVNTSTSALNIFGGPYQKIQLRAGFGAEAFWTFAADGGLTFPAGSKIVETTTTTIISPPGTNVGQSLVIRPTASGGTTETSHIHLISGDPTTVDLYLGDDDQYVKIEKNHGNVVIGTNTNTNHWILDTNGTLTLPNNNKITTKFLPEVGHIVTGVENYLASLGTNSYRWEVVSTALMSAINIPNGEGLTTGWIFYPVGNPAASVTVTNVIIGAEAATNVDILFSGTLEAGPYVARSANYVAAHYNPAVIGFGTTNWTFDSTGTLVSPVLTIEILPSATPAGQRAFISNGENLPTWGATVSSTGTTTYPVWSDGSVWKYG